MSIELSGLVKHFGNFAAVDNVDLHIETGELLALLALVTLALKYLVEQRVKHQKRAVGDRAE